MNPAYELNCEHDKPLRHCCVCMAAEVDRLHARIHEIQRQHDKQTATLRKECDLYRSFHDGRLEIMQQRYDMMTAPQRRAERAEYNERHLQRQIAELRQILASAPDGWKWGATGWFRADPNEEQRDDGREFVPTAAAPQERDK